MVRFYSIGATDVSWWRILFFRFGGLWAGSSSLFPWACMGCCTFTRGWPGPPKRRSEPLNSSLSTMPPRSCRWSLVSQVLTAAIRCNSEYPSGVSPWEIHAGSGHWLYGGEGSGFIMAQFYRSRHILVYVCVRVSPRCRLFIQHLAVKALDFTWFWWRLNWAAFTWALDQPESLCCWWAAVLAWGLVWASSKQPVLAPLLCRSLMAVLNCRFCVCFCPKYFSTCLCKVMSRWLSPLASPVEMVCFD